MDIKVRAKEILLDIGWAILFFPLLGVFVLWGLLGMAGYYFKEKWEGRNGYSKGQE